MSTLTRSALDTATAPATATTADRLLARCREWVRPALVAALDELHPSTRERAAYSFGWRDAAGNPDPHAAEGKGVRQALAVLGAESVGAHGTMAVPGAVAVELAHGFSLVHDDVMDGDATRRGRETVWKAYGTGSAVLVGDALFALAVRTLAQAPTAHAAAAVRDLSGTLCTLIRGQGEDLSFESRPWTGPHAVRPEEYRAMAERKTGALLGRASALGALLAGATSASVTALDGAGRQLGLAFQAVDDLLGIWGDPARTGKPVHSDLSNGKKTHPVLAALASDTTAARRLATTLDASTSLDADALRRVADLVEEAGGRAATAAAARRHVESAHDHLHDAALEPDAVREWESLFAFVLHRAR